MKEHYLYKYVYNDEIIYIGKTNSSLKQRINAHKKENKFQPYLDKCKIYIMELANTTEVNTLESLLINKYSPILNVIDKHENVTLFYIEEPEWEEYIDCKYTKKQIEKICIENEDLKKNYKKIKTDNVILKTENKCLSEKMYRILDRDRALETNFLSWVILIEEDIKKYKQYINEENLKEKPEKGKIKNYQQIIDRNEFWLWQLNKLTGYSNNFVNIRDIIGKTDNDNIINRIKNMEEKINKKYMFYPNGKIEISFN